MFDTPDTTTIKMAEPIPTPAAGNGEKFPPVIIDYIELPTLRTGYFSGLLAAQTPEGLVNVLGYVERKTYPTKAVYTFSEEEEAVKQNQEGPFKWVREIQASFLLDEAAIEAAIDLFQSTLQELKERNAKAKAEDE